MKELKLGSFLKTTIADCLALAMPLISAALSIATAMFASHALAVAFGIVAALASAIGVLATWQGSRVRDGKLRFWIEDIATAQAQSPSGFGS